MKMTAADLAIPVEHIDTDQMIEQGRALVEDIIDRCLAAQVPAAVLREMLDPANVQPIRAAIYADRTWRTSQFMRLQEVRLKTAGEQILKELRLIQGGPTTQTDDLRALTGVPDTFAPGGYHVDERGVWVVAEDMVRIAARPIVISGIARDIEETGVRLDLRWRDDQGWTRRTVERGAVMDSRSLVKLAHEGAPVHSGNSGALVEYLAAFEAANLHRLPKRTITQHMGWTGDAFLWGDCDLTGSGVSLEGEPAMLARARAYCEGGTWDGWCEATRRLVCPSPSVMLAVYASAAAPLLRIIGADGFVVDWSGETSQGKTTALRAAASVWGVPARDTGIIGSWSAPSTVGATVRAWFSQSMPVLLDDTKEGRDDVVAALLYMIPAGREGDKGTADGGLRRAKTWRTVLLSTGESPITSRSQDGGARARTLCIEGSPVRSGEQAIQIAEAMSEHHGHLGPRVVRYAIEHADDLRAAYSMHRDAYRAAAETAVQGRAAAYVAALRVAAEVCTAVGCPVPYEDPIELAIQAAADAGVSADRPREAMVALLSWCAAHQRDFYGQVQIQPHSGWAGVWQAGTSPIGMSEADISRVLSQSGYRFPDVAEAWRSRGWLDCAKGRSRKRMRMGDAYPWLVAVSADVVSSFLGDD